MLSIDQNLETVRALHRTIVSLRAALEQSRSELFQLRVKVNSTSSTKAYADTIEKLSLENHILRERLLSSESSLNVKNQMPSGSNEHLNSQACSVKESSKSCSQNDKLLCQSNKVMEETSPSLGDDNTSDEIPNKDNYKVELYSEDIEQQCIPGESTSNADVSEFDVPVNDRAADQLQNSNDSKPENVEPLQSPEKKDEKHDESIRVAEESDNESEELDDIELIFTTDETKELGVMQEDLVSISDNENWNSTDGGAPPCLTVEKGTQFDEENTGLCMPWAPSVVVETDISKCGIIDENEAPATSGLRRNTLPSPSPYRPIIHKEILSASKSPSHCVKFTAPRNSRTSASSDSRRVPMRPILIEQNSSPKRESEAQTDITALPSHWKSESYLAHKVSHHFTTLPSKFTLPPPRQTVHCRPSLKICDRNQDARRILLSDINFTSMVPELSRSADHLALESGTVGVSDSTASGPALAGLYRNFPRAFSYMKNSDGMRHCLVSPGYQHAREYGRFQWSPCDCVSQGKWECPLRCQSSQSSSTSPQSHEAEIKHRIPMKASMSSYDVCRHGHIFQRTSSSSWQSEPASPTHGRVHNRSRSIPTSSSYSLSRNKQHGAPTACNSRFSPATVLGHGATFSRNRVSFQEGCLRRPGRGGQSLPDLRIAEGHADSGESTDSLIDEAEDYVRHSIDSIITGTDRTRISRRKIIRRHSDPDPNRAQPFLPKTASDLKVDHLVKVITSEGRVTVGRVRYVGAVSGLTEVHVGLELANGSGDSDGTFHGRRYFECDPSCSIFVPFKKVVMAWRT